MKSKFVSLLATVIAATLFTAPGAHAAKVGKIAGNYTGSGTLIDKRSAPTSTYQYSFTDVKVKVSPKGAVSGSSTVTAYISSFGGPFLPITTQALTVTGTISKIKITKAKVTATGSLKFSDGTQVDGKFSVAAKTGKGTFKINQSDAQFDVSFVLTKKK